MDKSTRDKLYKLVVEDLNTEVTVSGMLALIFGVVLPVGLILLPEELGVTDQRVLGILGKCGVASFVLASLLILFTGNLINLFGLCHGSYKGTIAFRKYHLNDSNYYIELLREKEFKHKARPLEGELDGVVSVSDKELRTGYPVSKEYYYMLWDDARIYMSQTEFDNLYTLVKARLEPTFLVLNEEEYHSFEDAYKNEKRVELAEYNILT